MRDPRPTANAVRSSHLMRLVNVAELATPGEPFPPGLRSAVRVCKLAGCSDELCAEALCITVEELQDAMRPV